MNIKKLFATLAGVSLFAQTVVPSASVFGAGYSQELEDAYNWAYGKSITTMSPIENANMYGAITRAEMAKMLANWAKDKGETPDTSKACDFSDTASVKGDLATAIVEACQLGLMGQGITSFRPYDTISRAEFGTALSRALWGNKYEGGTPYYTNHLNALKAAGIMTQIANAESTKEVRGYVMLMLMRSEGGSEVSEETDCEDPLVVLACNSDSDACPAACKEDSNKDEDEVVKAGDLDVTTSENSNGMVFIGRDSELDTITLKTSEEVSISRIVLERIGYSTADNIVSVKLEDEKWATIADAKTLDSKGQVKLTLKKDYKVVDGELNAVIVVNTLNDWTTKALQPGATVGFKVVDVESTAKNVNISGKANTYTAIKFDGSKITFNITANADKEYNWEAGELYEVAKFKVTAPDDSSIVLRGFTFAKNTSTLDLRKYFDKAEVTVAGEKVSGLDASVNKDDELVVTFNDVEVPAKKKQEVIVKIALTEDYDSFNTSNVVKLSLKDFVAVDGKVESRVSSNTTNAGTPTYYGEFTQYTFKWGKIKIANVKLGNVDAAQNSEGIVVAEWSITVTEALKGSFYVDVTGKAAGAIKELTFSVNNEETDGSKYNLTNAPTWSATTAYKIGDIVSDGNTTPKYYIAKTANTNVAVTTTTDWNVITVPGAAAIAATDFARFYFNNVEIDKSGKIRFTIDTVDANTWDKESVNFSIFKADSFTSLVYDESNENAKNQVSGSMSFSKLTIQPAKASLTNSATKEVEFADKDSNRKVVFDGTYTAKKWDIELNKFSIEQSTASNASLTENKITFYLSIDGDEVADVKFGTDKTATVTDTFDNILVKAGDSVKVKLEAEVEADNSATLTTANNYLGKYELTVEWEDVNGNKAWEGSAKTVAMKVVEKGSVNISAGAAKETVLYKAADAEIAAFNVKPANGASETDLEEISFLMTKWTAAFLTSENDITVTINKIEADDCSLNTSAVTYDGASRAANTVVTCPLNEKLDSDWVNVVISLDDETTWVINVSSLFINGKKQTRTFKKRFEEALVWIKSMKDLGGTTEFTLGVDKDSDLTVKNLVLYFDTDGTAACSAAAGDCISSLTKVFDDGDTVEAKGIKDGVRLVRAISYVYNDGTSDHTVLITKDATNNEITTTYFKTIAAAAWVTAADNYVDFFKVGDAYARVYKSN